MIARNAFCTLLMVSAVLVAHVAAAANLHYLGTATGGVAIYYNDNGQGENATNVAYVRAQVSPTNTNGAIFNFDPALGLPPGYGPGHIFQSVPDQYGLDLIVAGDPDGSVPVPTLLAYDNVDGTVANRALAGAVGFAISHYTNATQTSVGPGDPATVILNSVARGNSGALTVNNLSQVGTVFTVDIEGVLETDGLIHWYNPASGTDPFTAIPYDGEVATGNLVFQGTISYDSAADPYVGMDFYSGTINLFVEAEAVPEPSTIALAGAGLIGLAAFAIRSRRMA